MNQAVRDMQAVIAAANTQATIYRPGESLRRFGGEVASPGQLVETAPVLQEWLSVKDRVQLGMDCRLYLLPGAKVKEDDIVRVGSTRFRVHNASLITWEGEAVFILAECAREQTEANNA